MSEVHSMSEVIEAPAPAATVGGAGRMLREAREATGMHVAALAVALKVPVRKLEALEADRHEDVGDLVFVRALAGSVCRALRVDPKPILERLPQGAQPRLAGASEGINEPFRAPSDAMPSGWAGLLTRPVALAVGALLLGAVVLMLLPMAQRGDDKPSAAKAPPPADAALPSAPLAQPSTGQAPAAGSAPAAEASTAPVQAVAVSLSPAASPAAPAAAPPQDVDARGPAAGPEVRPSASAAAADIISFRASGPSWVEVSDARGTVVLRRLLAAGESAGAAGAMPLKVTVGKADLTQVQVRGQAFDLQAVTRENVARFEVK